MWMYYPNDGTQHGKWVYNGDCIQNSGLGNLVSSFEGLYLIAKDADKEAYIFGSLRIPGPQTHAMILQDHTGQCTDQLNSYSWHRDRQPVAECNPKSLTLSP